MNGPIPKRPSTVPRDAGDAGIVEVWIVRLDSWALESGKAWDVLSHEERLRAERFRAEIDRHRFVRRRAARRWILARELDVDPRSLRFAEGLAGKPEIDGPGLRQVSFSAASSRDLALIALGRGGPIGIDVEVHVQLGAELEGLIGSLAVEERTGIRALPAALQLEAFYACWTRKEALLKAIGHGLSCGLESAAVTVDPVVPPEVLRIDGTPVGPPGWNLATLDYGPGISACIAGEGRFQIVHKEWVD